VLDANPLDNITNMRRISSAILRGAPVDGTEPVAEDFIRKLKYKGGLAACY
jgi:hypothetical protein